MAKRCLHPKCNRLSIVKKDKQLKKHPYPHIARLCQKHFQDLNYLVFRMSGGYKEEAMKISSRFDEQLEDGTYYAEKENDHE